MDSKQYKALASQFNTLWLNIIEDSSSTLLRSQLLGLGPDNALLCTLPEDFDLTHCWDGLPCKGRSLLDGETYQFETTIREVLHEPPVLSLTPPSNIPKAHPRNYPRLPVNLPGTIRPLSDTSQIIAVLPITLNDLCPTGCQIQTPASSWPSITTMQVLITCQLPTASHTSTFHGKIEWLDPGSQVSMGIQFQFSSEKDTASMDVRQWFTSQRATLVNTTV